MTRHKLVRDYSGLRAVELRDLGRIDSLARQVLEQTGHLRRNMARPGHEDRSRYCLIELRANWLLALAQRRVRVWQKEQAGQ